MGIKNLFKLIKKHAPNSIKYKNIDDFSNKYIVLDANMIIYQYVIAIRNTGKDLTNDNGKITSHILGIISKSLMLLKNNIMPIYIFDGCPPDFKSNTLKKRKKLKEKNQLRLNECKDEKDKVKYFKRSFTLKSEQIEEVKEILKLLGIPIITSKTEADPLCAELVKNGIAYGVSSEDMDILTFGSPILIRKLKNGKKNSIIEINLDQILKDFKMSMDQFIELCILLGCDYLPTIKKVGLIKAYNIIKEYDSIENFINTDPKIKSGYYKIPDDYDYKKIKKFFKNPPINNIKKTIFTRKYYNKFLQIMIQKYNFKGIQVNKFINLFKKYYKKLDL
tara:strand:+ start:1146 stop:2147 length:1002 start_codon:yes stop_codon:yes gene_type:complete